MHSDVTKFFVLIIKVAYLLLLVAMAGATIFEKFYGPAAASISFYGSWWFVSLWAIVAIAGLGYMLRRRLFRRPVVFALHVGLLLILAGAFCTHVLGLQGDMRLRVGKSVNTFSVDDAEVALPFAVALDSFAVRTYPGTDSASDFVSSVTFCDGASTVAGTISMNNVCDFRGYRFFQSGYDADSQGTHLRVSYDPWGVGLTYVGYAILFLAFALILVLPDEGFRRQLRKMSASGLSIVMMAVLSSSLTSCSHADQPAMPKALPQDLAAEFADLYVYYNGRICPMQTMAKDFTVKMCGKDRYRGLSSEQVLTGWLFYPASWGRQPIIKVKGEVASLVGRDGRYVCYDDLWGPSGYVVKEKLKTMRDDLSGARAFEEADEKVSLVLGVVSGSALRIFPLQTDGGLTWLAQDGHLPSEMPDDERIFVRKSFSLICEMASLGQFDEMRSFISKLKAYQRQKATGFLPSDQLFAAEKTYNRANITRPLAMAFATLGIVFFLVYVVRWSRGVAIPRWLHSTLLVVLALALAYMVCFVTLRGYVSGHLPLTNGYETMQFMAICAMALALVLHRRFVLVVPFGYLLAGLTLMVSMMGQANPQVSPLMPVLASPLLSIHVCVIMLAYSLVAFMMMCGVASFMVHGDRQVEALADVSRLLLYPAVAFLSVGIFVGAIWANQSWGRYWGWDPKEVWALITLMIYVIPLHPSLVPSLQRPRALHLFTVFAFLAVLMTYFGVNFFLGGLHSYANS